MEGEADSQRLEQGLHEDFLMDVEKLEEAELGDEECDTKMLPQQQKGSLNKKLHHIVLDTDGQSDPEIHWTESLGLFPANPVCVPDNRWTISGKEEDNQDKLLYPCCPAEGSGGQRSPIPMLKYWVCPGSQHNIEVSQRKKPVSPPVPPRLNMPHLSISIPGFIRAIACPEVSNLISDTSSPCSCLCSLTSSDWDAVNSTSRSPRSSNQDPVNAAAHLHLLGESLSLIGHHLKETSKTVCVSSSFSLLLDSLLCALAPLMCLTTQIPELTSCMEYTLASTLENVAYVMPGL